MTIVNTLRAHPFRSSVGLYIIFNSLFLALVVIKPGSHQAFVIADDVGQAVGWLLGTLLCFVNFTLFWQSDLPSSMHFKTKGGLRGWASFFIALGIFASVLAR